VAARAAKPASWSGEAQTLRTLRLVRAKKTTLIGGDIDRISRPDRLVFSCDPVAPLASGDSRKCRPVQATVDGVHHATEAPPGRRGEGIGGITQKAVTVSASAAGAFGMPR